MRRRPPTSQGRETSPEIKCSDALILDFCYLNHPVCDTTASSHLQFLFRGFSCSRLTAFWKHKMENSSNKQLISFKLCTVMSSVVKSCAVLLCPAWDKNHPFVLLSMSYMPPSASPLVAVWVIRWAATLSHCLCSRDPYFTSYWPKVQKELQLYHRYLCVRKNTVYAGLHTTCGFRHPLGTSPSDKGCFVWQPWQVHVSSDPDNEGQWGTWAVADSCLICLLHVLSCTCGKSPGLQFPIRVTWKSVRLQIFT